MPLDDSALWDVVIVGGGAAGLAAAASLLKRKPGLTLAIVEPSDRHYYQPAWTLVGGGCFNPTDTCRSTASLIPANAKWIRSRVTRLLPQQSQVELENGQHLSYRSLVVAPGLELNWGAIAGLEATLGKNGVTSNYRYDLAPYTWECVQALKQGRALFTQPAMPIKCAGAPQKAMYLSCHHWEEQGCLGQIEVHFHNTGGVLFGVSDFVPPLMEYVKRYNAQLHFTGELIAVDIADATFRDTNENGESRERSEAFDMLHVVPPQRAPAFVRNGELANQAGWVAVDEATCNTPTTPTFSAWVTPAAPPNACRGGAQASPGGGREPARAPGQAPERRLCRLRRLSLTVEKGKVVLAEFGGGKLQPTLNPAVARTSMWWLKRYAMPRIYFSMMLKGHEWLARPEKR